MTTLQNEFAIKDKLIVCRSFARKHLHHDMPSLPQSLHCKTTRELTKIKTKTRCRTRTPKRQAHVVITPALRERIVPALSVNRKRDTGVIPLGTHVSQIDTHRDVIKRAQHLSQGVKR